MSKTIFRLVNFDFFLMNNRINLILNYIILVFSIAINPSYWGKNIKNLKKKLKKKKKTEQNPLRNIQSWEAA